MSAVAKVIPDDGPADDSYVSRTGQDPIPVQKDEAPVEDPINPATADSDEALGEPSYPFFFFILTLPPNPSPFPPFWSSISTPSTVQITNPFPPQPVTTPKPSTPTTLSTVDALVAPSLPGHTVSRATRRVCRVRRMEPRQRGR